MSKEDKVQNAQNSIKQGIKTKMYDIISAAIITVLIALSLGVIERRVITLSELSNIVIECVPFYLAFMLLGSNYYSKGSFVGKETERFAAACKRYSSIVDELSEEEVSYMDEFCEYYNEKSLRLRQTAYLKRAAITYTQFNEGDDALKLLDDYTLKQTYGKERAKWIICAKNTEIKGIRTNTLTGTTDSTDPTDVGKTEAELTHSHTSRTAINYASSTILMSLMAVRDVTKWHWFGFALVLFKCIFILCKAYVEYFTGYNDVTIHLVNHTTRKADILKEFKYWFNNIRNTVK